MVTQGPEGPAPVRDSQHVLQSPRLDRADQRRLNQPLCLTKPFDECPEAFDYEAGKFHAVISDGGDSKCADEISQRISRVNG